MTYAMYTLDKQTPDLRAVLALHAARYGPPRLALVAPGAVEAVPGVVVREAKAGEGTIGRGIVWVAL